MEFHQIELSGVCIPSMGIYLLESSSAPIANRSPLQRRASLYKSEASKTLDVNLHTNMGGWLEYRKHVSVK